MDKLKISIIIFSTLILIQAIRYFDTSLVDGLILVVLNVIATIALAKGTENV